MPELNADLSCRALPLSKVAISAFQLREKGFSDAGTFPVPISDLANVLVGEIEAAGNHRYNTPCACSGGKLRLKRYKIHGENQLRVIESDISTTFITRQGELCVDERERENQRIADRIQQLRKRLGLNQQAFAARVGFNQTTVSKWEGNRARPTPEAFARLAQLSGDAKDQNFFLAYAGIPEGFFSGGNSIPVITPRVVPFDAELLTFVIETVNQKLKKMNRKFTDDRKYAALVVAFYELCHGTRQRNPDMVDHLLKIA